MIEYDVKLNLNDKKSMSLEFISKDLDTLIFRLNRAGVPFREYKHRSTKVTVNHEVQEETEARLLILTNFEAFRVLNLFDNDLLHIVVDNNIEEACIYENIINVEKRHWSETFLSLEFSSFGTMFFDLFFILKRKLSYLVPKKLILKKGY